MRREWPGPAPPRRPPYLFTTLSDGGRELTDYHIHTLDTGLFELLHLLFHCGFKSEVRCEETCPAPGKEEGTGGGATTGRRVGREEEGSLSRAGPGSGVEDGTGMGGERETPTWRKRERTEDNVSVGPGPPYRPPGLARPGCCPRPRGSVSGGAGLLQDQAPAEFRSSPQGLAPRSSATPSLPSLSFPMPSLSQRWVLLWGLTQARTPPGHSVQF